MKIRNGFVSNSSSSSFILYGIMLDNNDEDYQDWCNKYLDKKLVDEYIRNNFEDEDIEWADVWYECTYESDKFDIVSCGYSGNVWIGKKISGDYEDHGSISIDEINESIKELKELFPEEEFKIHYGTYGC